MVKIGMVQMSCLDDVEANRAKAVEGIHRAADQGARIICLQELFLTPYFCKREDVSLFSLAESVPGRTTDAMSEIARELGVVLIVSLFEKRASGLYHNTAAVIDADGTCMGTYRKMHIPDDPMYYEKFYFTPGDLGYRSWKTRYGTIGVLVCWDQWFPEAARLTAMSGAQILFYPTAIGWHLHEKEAQGEIQHASWETVQRGHAVANGCYVVAVNRVGLEESIQFYGGSFVADPHGQVIHKASFEEEAVSVVEVDLDGIDKVRCHWPFLRDRRIDSYSDLTKLFLE